MLDDKDICEAVETEDSAFDKFYQENTSGIAFIPTPHQRSEGTVMSSVAGDFAKWINQNHSELNVDVRKSDKKLLLRSFDVYLPFVYLAQEPTLQAYLILVAEYARYKMRGLLRGESSRIDLTVVYKNKKKGTTSKFKFAGDVENLGKVIETLNSSND